MTAQLTKPIHGESNQIALQCKNGVTLIDKPYDWTEIAPEGCKIKLGDLVEYTNHYGVTFERRVWGFADPSLHSEGRCVYLHVDCYWFPVDPILCKVISEDICQ